MASEIKNQNVTDNDYHNLLRNWAIRLRKDRSLYDGLDRGREAAEGLAIIEADLVKRTGRTW